MNDPCFELGNTVAESKLGHERLERLIELYFGAPLRNRVARAHLWAAMANYGWTLWACIQREVSDIDFDFWEWGVDDKYARAVTAFTGPELERLARRRAAQRLTLRPGCRRCRASGRRRAT